MIIKMSSDLSFPSNVYNHPPSSRDDFCSVKTVFELVVITGTSHNCSSYRLTYTSATRTRVKQMNEIFFHLSVVYMRVYKFSLFVTFIV